MDNKKFNLENKEDPNKILLENIKESIGNTETLKNVSTDFNTTFHRLGVQDENQSNQYSQFVLSAISNAKTIEEAENKIKSFFKNNLVDKETIFQKIEAGLQGRRELVFSQLEPHLKNIKGKVIDYGAGSGQITQMIHDKLSLDIEGIDVRNFKDKEVTVPMKIFDGYKAPVEDGYYDAAVLTNVIHHEKDNEKILAELSRIVKNKLVIIETVPEADNDEDAKKDWGRMLLNDTLWNRFFNYANIPVPGTYDTPEGWIKRFQKYGWKEKVSEDLGFDQPTIQDRHHLLVFER